MSCTHQDVSRAVNRAKNFMEERRRTRLQRADVDDCHGVVNAGSDAAGEAAPATTLAASTQLAALAIRPVDESSLANRSRRLRVQKGMASDNDQLGSIISSGSASTASLVTEQRHHY